MSAPNVQRLRLLKRIIPLCVAAFFAIAAWQFGLSTRGTRQTGPELEEGKSLETTEKPQALRELPSIDGNFTYEQALLWAWDNFPRTMERVQLQIAEVEEESFAVSMAKLSDVEMYFWPGVQRDSIEFPEVPLPSDFGLLDLDRIYSNRRVQKLMEEFLSVPRADACATIQNSLRNALEEYKDLYYVEVLEHPALSDERHNGSFGYRTSNMPDGAPTLQGSRLEILGLLVIIANLQYTELRPAVNDVLHLALEQRDFMYSPNINRAFAFHALEMASLYNRPILAAALMGTDSSPSVGAGIEWKNGTLTKFTAHVSQYDLVTEYGIPPDWRPGALKITFVGKLDEESFNNLLAELSLP